MLKPTTVNQESSGASADPSIAGKKLLPIIETGNSTPAPELTMENAFVWIPDSKTLRGWRKSRSQSLL
jgi:hypothetical protein